MSFRSWNRSLLKLVHIEKGALCSGNSVDPQQGSRARFQDVTVFAPSLALMHVLRLHTSFRRGAFSAQLEGIWTRMVVASPSST